MRQAVLWGLLAAALVMIGLGVAGWIRDRRRRVVPTNDWAGGIISMTSVALIVIGYLNGAGSVWIPTLIGSVVGFDAG